MIVKSMFRRSDDKLPGSIAAVGETSSDVLAANRFEQPQELCFQNGIWSSLLLDVSWLIYIPLVSTTLYWALSIDVSLMIWHDKSDAGRVSFD